MLLLRLFVSIRLSDDMRALEMGLEPNSNRTRTLIFKRTEQN